MSAKDAGWTRRELLIRAARSAGVFGAGTLGGATLLPIACGSGVEFIGPPEVVDSNGLMLPQGFSSRIVARTDERVAGTNHVWHRAPDGGATFASPGGGWVYVSNSEVDLGGGGVGAIRFSANAAIIDAYSILDGTDRNCAGGPTPWNTWLSCEEVPRGRVYECDPFTPGSQGIVRPALGLFNHEAAAVDPVRRHVYLTEDEPDGLLYRFTPTSYPSLDAGLLEAAEILDPGAAGPIVPGETRSVDWHVVSDPGATSQPTRRQAPQATMFNGGEGCSYRDGRVFFSTKGDDRVWSLDARTNQIEILYDRLTSTNPILSNVDNVYAAPSGDVYVAEDPGDLQIVVLTRSGQVKPVVQVLGQVGSEITGPALDPSGTRLYFSSQRFPGTTYEVTGPF